MNDKIIFGLVTLCIGITSYSFYFWNIFRNKTKPDAASWFIWGFLATITFFAQTSEGAGAGAWATGLTAVMCFSISVTAYRHGYKKIKTIDTVGLFGALFGLILWTLTNNPLTAVEATLFVGAMGFVPTFRKAFEKPHEETATTYGLNTLKFAIALFALQSFTPVTWLYPAGMTIMNISLTTMLIVRKKQLS